MKDEAKKKIAFLIIILMLVVVMYFQSLMHKERQENVEREILIPEKTLPDQIRDFNIKKEDKELLKQRQEEAQIHYFKEQADWAGIGEGED